MNEIVFSPTSIAIYNYKNGYYKKFMNKLSVWETTQYGGRYKTWEAFIEDTENEILYIHRGIEVSDLNYYFPKHHFEFDTGCTPYKKSIIKMTGTPRDDTQRNSIDFLTSTGEFQDLKDEPQRFLCLKPGDGKTFCAINYICKKKLIPIIIIESNRILEQWKESFLKFTDISEDEICVFSGRNSVDKIMKKGYTQYKVFIGKHQTLQSYCKDDWTKINDIICKIGAGVKIFDEAHAYWKSIFYIDMYTDVQNTIYLTATPYLSNPYENEVYKKMFSSIITYGLDLKFDQVYHRIVYAKWNSHPTDIEEFNMSNAHGFDSNRYNDYLLLDKNIDTYLDYLDNLVVTFVNNNPNVKIAVVVNCNNMVEKLYKHYTNDDVFDIERSVGMYCGLIKNKKDRLAELDKDIIVTTLKGFNKGVDVERLGVVINTVSISSKTLTDQLAGRLRYNKNYKSYFVDITDEGFKQCVNHAKIRARFLNKIAKSTMTFEPE
jgi:hypothetical protein